MAAPRAKVARTKSITGEIASVSFGDRLSYRPSRRFSLLMRFNHLRIRPEVIPR